jgi:hypothetical protein
MMLPPGISITLSSTISPTGGNPAVSAIRSTLPEQLQCELHLARRRGRTRDAARGRIGDGSGAILRVERTA